MKFNIFELGILSFNSHVYYLTRGFIAPTRAFNLPTRVFNLPTRAFSLLTRESELVTRLFQLVNRGYELVTRNACFTFPRYFCVMCRISQHFSHRALKAGTFLVNSI